MTMAISRHGDGKTASAKPDDFGCEGVFEYDLAGRTLRVVRGTLGTVTAEELPFRIWFQTQDIRWSRARGLKEWAGSAG